jgi:hypothetical protein
LVRIEWRISRSAACVKGVFIDRAGWCFSSGKRSSRQTLHLVMGVPKNRLYARSGIQGDPEDSEMRGVGCALIGGLGAAVSPASGVRPPWLMSTS